MKDQIKYALYMMGIGLALAAYGHNNFAPKSIIDILFDKVDTIDKRVYEIHRTIGGSNGK